MKHELQRLSGLKRRLNGSEREGGVREDRRGKRFSTHSKYLNWIQIPAPTSQEKKKRQEEKPPSEAERSQFSDVHTAVFAIRCGMKLKCLVGRGEDEFSALRGPSEHVGVFKMPEG